MRFAQWLEQQAARGPEHFFQSVKNYVLANMQFANGVAEIHFPNDYSQFVQEPIRLAASVLEPGKLVESVKDKGVKTYLSLTGKDPLAAAAFSQYSPSDLDRFIKVFDSQLKFISHELGTLFETATYLELVKKYKLTEIGDQKTNEVKAMAQNILTRIEKRTDREFRGYIRKLVYYHSKSMADSIKAKADSSLECDKRGVTRIKFAGGPVAFKSIRKTADLYLMCAAARQGKQWKAGFSLKFVSETRIPVATMLSGPLGASLGQKAIKKLNKEVVQRAGTMKNKDFANWMVEEMQPLYDNIVLPANKKKLEFLINKLFFGIATQTGPTGEEEAVVTKGKTQIDPTFLSYRNYVKNVGGADVTEELSKDFDVSDPPGMRITIPKTSTVTSGATQRYNWVNVKGPSSTHGTTIRFTPELQLDDLHNMVNIHVAMTGFYGR